MNPALEDLTVRNFRLEATVASLKAERLRTHASFSLHLNRAEEIAEMWKKDIQKYAQEYQVAESKLRGAESRSTEMQRKHKAEIVIAKNLAHSEGWAGGFKAAERMNTRGIEEIKQMHRSELCEVEKALKAQYLRLRREDPMVYMVKLFRSGGTTAYMTRCPSHGFLQFFAQDLKHSALRLFSSRKDAKIVCESLVTGYPWKTITYEVVEMPKQDIYSLPCYEHYHTHEAFQPQGTNED
jgi:hypothetical protein